MHADYWDFLVLLKLRAMREYLTRLTPIPAFLVA